MLIDDDNEYDNEYESDNELPATCPLPPVTIQVSGQLSTEKKGVRLLSLSFIHSTCVHRHRYLTPGAYQCL